MPIIRSFPRSRESRGQTNGQDVGQSLGPRHRVWSRGIIEGLERGDVSETLETGSIVVVNKAIEKGISIGVGEEAPVGAAAFGLSADGLNDAAVEAFDHAVGLRMIGFGEAVVDF